MRIDWLYQVSFFGVLIGFLSDAFGVRNFKFGVSDFTCFIGLFTSLNH